MQWDDQKKTLRGPGGSLPVSPQDEITRKLAMLVEGECEGLGPLRAAAKFGYSKQRYFQLRQAFHTHGAAALQSQRRGPKSNYRRTEEVVRQVIRHRFLDPEASAQVIGQKLRQTGQPVSTRSVERVLEDYGLQKKLGSLERFVGGGLQRVLPRQNRSGPQRPKLPPGCPNLSLCPIGFAERIG